MSKQLEKIKELIAKREKISVGQVQEAVAIITRLRKKNSVQE